MQILSAEKSYFIPGHDNEMMMSNSTYIKFYAQKATSFNVLTGSALRL